jgi:hypothetical protein
MLTMAAGEHWDRQLCSLQVEALHVHHSSPRCGRRRFAAAPGRALHACKDCRERQI